MFYHPERTSTIHDIPEIVGHTFPKAMTPINIQAEYRVAGLVPVNRDVFEDCYFMPAKTSHCSKPVNNTTPETDNSVHDANKRKDHAAFPLF